VLLPRPLEHPSTPTPPLTTSPNKFDGKNNNSKKRKANDNKKILVSSSRSGAQPLPWSAPHNPWTGLDQAWPLPIWWPSAPGLLGSCPRKMSQQALAATLFQPVFDNNLAPNHQAPVGLMASLHGVPPAHQYIGGSNWIMDTGASYDMANHPGILTSSFPPPLHTSIIVGNITPLLVLHFGSSIMPARSTPLHLNNVLISPHLIKNLISDHALTRDKYVSVTSDPFGFSIKDFRTGMIIL
jgi:hypothetical protein